jgi:hypothetical protein
MTLYSLVLFVHVTAILLGNNLVRLLIDKEVRVRHLGAIR